jgi:hypothetical protein
MPATAQCASASFKLSPGSNDRRTPRATLLGAGCERIFAGASLARGKYFRSVIGWAARSG